MSHVTMGNPSVGQTWGVGLVVKGGAYGLLQHGEAVATTRIEDGDRAPRTAESDGQQTPVAPHEDPY